MQKKIGMSYGDKHIYIWTWTSLVDIHLRVWKIRWYNAKTLAEALEANFPRKIVVDISLTIL